MSRDLQFREDAARLQAIEDEWLAEIPLRDMARFGWIPGVRSRTQRLAASLQFFGVPSLNAWRHAYAEIQQAVAFRTSASLESRPAAIAAWLRRGEIEAESVECGLWNPELLRASLPQLRALTREKDPEHFLPELQRICAAAGVVIAVVRAPAGCRASGATRFLRPTKALVLLSFRYLRDDQFWFSFFHELGHLLLHEKHEIFLEGLGDVSNMQEQTANDFAAEVLVPAEYRDEMLRVPVNGRAVIRFARRIGVSRGVIVGQLQHSKRLRPNQLNNLKARYRWQEASEE
jgi:hypothetical protein